MTVPTFLVAGAPRSGTTALVEGLRSHPDVFITNPKEPHYFAFHGQQLRFRDARGEAPVNSAAITHWSDYCKLYPADGSYAALGDGSATTLYYARHALSEILRVNRNMRLVILLRDPVDRCWSSYLYLRARGIEPCKDVMAAIAAEDDRKANNWAHLYHYTSESLYSRDLRTLIDGLGADRVGVWFHDQLNADYPAVLGQVEDFLGLDPHPGGPPTMNRINASGTPRVQSAQHAIAWARRHPVVKGALKHAISFTARERIKSAVLRRETLPDHVRRQLTPRFAEDLAEVAKLVPEPHPNWLASIAQGHPSS